MVAKTTWKCLLLASCDGLTSSDVPSGKYLAILVDWMFFCSLRKCPLLVARDLNKCFVMRAGVSPGHD